MIPRQEPLERPPLLLATAGAAHHGSADSIEAYRLALRLGATGIETVVRLTRDGVAVVRVEPRAGGLRRRRVSELDAADLPPGVLTLAGLLVAEPALQLLLQIPAPDAFDAALDCIVGHAALERTWLVGSPSGEIRRWRSLSPAARLIDATPLSSITGGVERHCAQLREDGIDGLAGPAADWSGGRTALAHRFGRRCVALAAPHERHILKMLHIGVDMVCCAHPDRLADALRLHQAPDAPLLLDD